MCYGIWALNEASHSQLRGMGNLLRNLIQCKEMTTGLHRFSSQALTLHHS